MKFFKFIKLKCDALKQGELVSTEWCEHVHKIDTYGRTMYGMDTHTYTHRAAFGRVLILTDQIFKFKY